MRVFRIDHEGAARFARAVSDDELELLPGAPWATPASGVGAGAPSGVRVRLSRAILLAPVEPSKIVCVGRNYRAHAQELGNQVPREPLIFLKPPSSLLAPGAAIELPAGSQRVEHEAEIGIVIGQRLQRANVDRALQSIFGVTAVNDVTARDIQKSEVQFTRAKGFDTFCPVGPVIETAADLTRLTVSGRVNGQERQSGTVAEMIFDIGTLLSFISHVMTLEPGDLVSTGTPAGVGPLVPGDVVEVEVSGVGVLRNGVRTTSSSSV
jgi:2-keto-4-pentenoate hydratase/2-oxohepta-3-ene-1,7-dioic acid hydratase in catechol pathway